ncbi:PREDICTED: uncharacterized protein LOC109218965 [Nicotiana attenuata]|uniref:uncharacterized protein LOC109218965 n=1 Tax=Nicotiana attenuata TaxID=49451 RepID=UPI0009056186|nr:PREDICTED: uncharacterized protein LOC109218965 [Nicotiana attenuata]
MYEMVGKLNSLKGKLKQLSKEKFSHIEKQTDQAQEELLQCQHRLQQRPLNRELQEEEARIISPDGYGSKFFKDSWEVVGRDVVDAIMEFFRTGKMLRVLNHTVITIIPKSSHATSVGDYRPIAGCNTIYKVISKMLCNKLRLVLPTLIFANQSAFVSGRTIVQNILIFQDLVRLYNRKNTTQSCLIKIDLKKAYDTVEWTFVEEILYAMNFPQRFIK